MSGLKQKVLLTIGIIVSGMLLLNGCTSKESDTESVGKKEWQAIHAEAEAEAKEVITDNTSQIDNNIQSIASQINSKSYSKSLNPKSETTPSALQEVNGLVPYVEASDELAKDPAIQNLLKQAKGKIQVIEFFNYPCPWCSHIDPLLQQWLKTKPKEITFIRVPVLFHLSWSISSKVYYAIEALAIKNGITNTEAIHAAFFELLKKNPETYRNLPEIYTFFVQQGLIKKDNEKTFIEMLNAIDDNSPLVTAYNIKAIPTFVVQGKKGIYSTNLNFSGTPENLFTIIDYLAAINR